MFAINSVVKPDFSNERERELRVLLIPARVSAALVHVHCMKSDSFSSAFGENMNAFSERRSLNAFMHNTGGRPLSNVGENGVDVGFEEAPDVETLDEANVSVSGKFSLMSLHGPFTSQ